MQSLYLTVFISFKMIDDNKTLLFILTTLYSAMVYHQLDSAMSVHMNYGNICKIETQ